jgi:asparagine synthase (glutamine-hydrolysing)
MCGVAGFLEPGRPEHELRAQVARMLRTITHRGPDDEGAWTAPGVALGHRRLSVVELSAAGHQPMASASGRFLIIFNGEIYNHVDLRAQLEHQGHTPPGGWRGHSDTETLLEAMAAWGITVALQASVGMFALAVWDREQATLTLARDRMGEKPLHFGWQGKAFLFASELKALRAHDGFAGDVDWDAAGEVLQLGYVHAPRTIFRGIQKLPPGHVLTLTERHVASRSVPESMPYWSLAEAARAGEQRPFAGGYGQAVDALEALVRQSVRLQSMADVPVGAFLSGGIDSSTVVAMMQEVAGARVTTFSIGMPEPGMDESRMAAAVARHLGTEHVEHVVQPSEALALVPRLAALWDEPFADSSQIPTYLVCRLARQRVTVALSGDGGDELFLGYPQYAMLQKLWRLRPLGLLPWGPGLHAADAIGNEWLRRRAAQARSVVTAWRQRDVHALNRYWMNAYRQDALPLRRTTHVNTTAVYRRGTAETAALADAASYLPDDILVKVDRAAMANSLETRAPLLDHRIVEFALSLPTAYKLGAGTGKRVLRDVLYRHVPRTLVDRPKMGFSIPLDRWLRGELREWAEAMLARIPSESHVFDRAAVQAIWTDHLSGRRNRSQQLWPVLALAAWSEEYGASL